MEEALRRGKENPNWRPLESNPDGLTQLGRQIGLPESWAFHDCFGLDDDLLAFLPTPVVAVVLLFPWEQEALRKGRKPQGKTLDKCFWMEQHVGNACGTIAVVHSIIANRAQLKMDPACLVERFYIWAAPLSPADRGDLLGGMEELESIAEAAALTGQTAPVEAEASVNYHFVAFACVEGHVVEFDGGKPSYIVHAECAPEEFMKTCAGVIREEYFARSEDGGNFSIIVLAPSVD
jgi:ubiquitin carboxyl-terminal hydrolase L3